MKTLLSVLLASLSLCAQAKSSLLTIKSDHNVELGPQAQAAFSDKKGLKPVPFKDLNEDVQELFEGLPKTSPIAFEADLNSDSVTDGVILMTDQKTIYVFAILSQGNSFEAVEVDHWARAPETSGEKTYVTILDKKKVRLQAGSKRKVADVIQVETYLGAVNAYFATGTQLQPYKGKMW